MRKNGGREKKESPVHQGAPHGKFHGDLSSSTPDGTDEKILTLAADRPVTLLNISKRIDIPFVECLRRVRDLERKGFLERIGDLCEPAQLHLYVATKQGSGQRNDVQEEESRRGSRD
ncbi:MAG: Lrp/AsnC family transcriptional regulator [Methanomassiliicoccales archaeon]|nr:MAG: Lrp/AsnC family transcriptional regulator [Methanomassiliicoccales archaeon]